MQDNHNHPSLPHAQRSPTIPLGQTLLTRDSPRPKSRCWHRVVAVGLCMVTIIAAAKPEVGDPNNFSRDAYTSDGPIQNAIVDAANATGSWVTGAVSTVGCSLGLGGCPAPPPRRESSALCTSNAFGLAGLADKAEELVAYAFGSAKEFKCMD
jgi:hypothetical protein